MPGRCPKLRAVPAFAVEHFHSVPRRVSWGTGPFRRALLLQEHRLKDSLCGELRVALRLAGVRRFTCAQLLGSEHSGVDHREGFLRRALRLKSEVVRAIENQYMGTGALFTGVFASYDLLLVWHTTNGTVQRLANALATGVPVIARTAHTHREAFGAMPGVMMADGVRELTRMALALNGSSTLRAATSNAGVAAAAQFSRAAIAKRYRLVLRAAQRTLPTSSAEESVF
jgi:hypothetical protein